MKVKEAMEFLINSSSSDKFKYVDKDKFKEINAAYMCDCGTISFVIEKGEKVLCEECGKQMKNVTKEFERINVGESKR